MRTHTSRCMPRGRLLVLQENKTPQLVGILRAISIPKTRFLCSTRVENGVRRWTANTEGLLVASVLWEREPATYMC